MLSRDRDAVLLGFDAVLIEHAREDRHELRIELSSSASLELSDGDIVRQGFAVAAIGGHRVVAIGDGDDTSEERNVSTDEAARIAAAVPVLVVTPRAGNELASVWVAKI